MTSRQSRALLFKASFAKAIESTSLFIDQPNRLLTTRSPQIRRLRPKTTARRNNSDKLILIPTKIKRPPNRQGTEKGKFVWTKVTLNIL